MTRHARPQEGTAYAAVFLSVLRNVSKDDTTQYVLAVLDEALTGARSPATQFEVPSRTGAPPRSRLLRPVGCTGRGCRTALGGGVRTAVEQPP